MQLSSITLKNWKGLTGTVPIHSRTWVHGQTGEGKTAIFEAIRFLYEGRVSCGARPKDVGKYVRGPEASVTGELSDGFAWTRTVNVTGDGKVAITTTVSGTQTKNSTQADAVVFAKVGRYGPCFAMSEWLSLTPEKIREQLTQLSDSLIDPATIKARARVLAIAELIGHDVVDGIAFVVTKGANFEGATIDQLGAIATEASAKVPSGTMAAVDRLLNRSLTGEGDLGTALPIVLDLLSDAKSANKKEYKLIDQQRSSAADMVSKLSKDPVSVDELRKNRLAVTVRRDELQQQIGRLEGVAASLDNEKGQLAKVGQSIGRIEVWLTDNPAPDLAAVAAETDAVIHTEDKAAEARQAYETQRSFHAAARTRALAAQERHALDRSRAEAAVAQADKTLARILGMSATKAGKCVEKARHISSEPEVQQLLIEALDILQIDVLEREYDEAKKLREREEAAANAAREAEDAAANAVRRADDSLRALEAVPPAVATATDAVSAAKAKRDEAQKQAELVLTSKQKLAALQEEQDRCRERIGVLTKQWGDASIDTLRAERDGLLAKAHEIDKEIEAAAGREGMLRQFAELRARCDDLLCEGLAIEAVMAAIKIIRDTTLLDITAPLRSRANALLSSIENGGEVALVFSAPSGAPVFDILYHAPDQTDPVHYDALAEGEQCLIRAALAYGLVSLTTQQASKILLLEASATSLRPAARIAEMFGKAVDATFPILVCHHTMQCITPPWQAVNPTDCLSREEVSLEVHE